MRERQDTSLEKAPFNICPICYLFKGSTEAGHDSMGSCRQIPSSSFEVGPSDASGTDTRGRT